MGTKIDSMFMRRVRFLKPLLVVVAFALASIVNVDAQSIPSSEKKAMRAFFNEQFSGSARLKGVNGTIPSLDSEYCSEDGYVELVPPTIDSRTESIVWTVVAYYGGTPELHPEWADYSGTGASTVLRFYPGRVDATYHNTVRIYFGYQQYDDIGNPVGIADNDYTYVRTTPTEFTFGSDVSICAGQTATLTLNGSETGIEYFLVKDGVEGIPVSGTGNSMDFSVTAAGTYSMRAKNVLDNSCSKDMAGSAVVTVNPLPSASAGNTGDVCLGSDFTLEGDPDDLTNYTWSNPDASEAGTTQDLTLSSNDYGIGSHTFTLTVEDENTCVNTATTTVTVFENPAVIANNSGPICVGGDLTVSSTVTGGVGPYTYAWTHVPSGATYNTDAFTINNVTLAAAGEYQLIVTDANLCSAVMASTIVVVNDNPTVTVPLGPTTICEGEPLTIAATAAGGSGTYNTYTWYHNGIEIPGQTAATLTIDPVAMANMGAYTVIVTDSNGCVSLESAPAMVVVIPFFKPTVGNDSPVCEGGDVQLTCDAGPYVKYTWTGPNGFTSDVQNPPISGITLAGAGTYSLTVEDMNGCTGTETTDVIVNPNPTVTASNTGPVCQGGSVDITATPAGGTGPYTYVWQKDGNPITPVSDVFTINPVALTDAGLYSVTVTDDNTCSSTVPGTTNLVVNANPTVSLAYNNPVCDGSTLTLTATPAGGSGVYNSYVWTKGGVVIPGETASTLTINPATLTDAGDYGVTVIDNIGCTSAEDVINVVINALPAVNASSNSEVCVGDQLELYGEPASMTSYTWTGPNSFSNNTEQNPIVSANATLAMAGTYTLEVFDGTCRATATTDVVVNTVTAVLTTTPAVFTVCEDTELTFSANGQDGSGDYNYEFFVDGATQGPASTDKTLSLIITADVSVEVEVTDNVTGCKDRASTSITMIAKPVVAIQSPNDGDAFCESEAITFVATPGYTKYEFFAGPSASPTLMYEGPNNTYTHAAGFTVDTDVAVRATNASGCEALSTIINIVINARPTPAINGNTDVCFNSIEDYTTDNGSGESNWIWTVTGGTIIGVDNDFTVKVQWDGPAPYSISVNYDNSDACAAETPSTQGITVNPLPTPTVEGPAVACNGSTQIYTTPDVGMTNYKWTVSAGGTIDGADNGTSVTIVWNTMGAQSVSLTYTDVNSCDAATPTVYNVNVTDLPSPTIDGSDMSANVCTEHTYTYFTEAGANNYDWQIAGGTITPTANEHEVTVVWNTTGAQWISVNYDVAGCPAAAATVHNVTVSAVPVVAIDGVKDLCFGDTETYAANTLGLGKGNYTWVISGGTLTSGALDEETIDITWDGVAPYTISLNYVNVNGCDAVNPTIENITVNVVTAGLSADKTTICSIEDVTFTATGGVTYEFYVDAVSVQGPDPSDTYVASGLTDGQVVTVRAIGATGCDDTHAGIPITVNPLPAAGISSSDLDNTICEGDEVTFTGSGGDLYEFFINGTSVAAPSAANTYVTNTLVDGDRVSVNVTNTTTTCSQMSGELVHTVNSLPTAGLTADTGPNIITGTDVTFTATGGVEYEFFKNTILIQARSGVDTYGPVNDLVDGDVISVNVYNANDCMASASIAMSVVDGITPYDLLSSSTEYCEDESGVSLYLATPQAGVSYRLIRTSDDQVINPIILFDGTNTVRWDDVTVPAALTTEEFRVEGFYPTVPGSEIEMNNRVTITRNNLPTVYSILPTGTVTGCGGGAGHEVKLENSETGVSYQLMLDGGNIGTPVVGNTGNEITFGFQTIFGEYTIMATNTTTGCGSLMSNTFTIDPDGTYASFDVSGDGNFCVGDAGADVVLEGSEVGVEYRVIRDGIENGDTWTGDGSAHSFGPYTTEGSYSVVVNTATGCKFPMNGVVSVVEVALPKSYDLEAANNGHFCPSDVITITISGQQNGVDYELFHNDVSVVIVTGTLDDDTAPLSFGDYGVAGTYRVEARTTGVVCSAPMNNELILVEDALPTVFNVTSDGDYCTGGTTFLHLDGSESDVQYRWEREGDLVTGPWIDGNGGILDFEITGTDTYYIVAMRKDGVTSCTSEMTPRIAITEKVYADLTKVLSIKPGTGLDCNNGAVVIVEASEIGVVYELVKSGVRTGNIVTGVGNDVEFPTPVLDIAATYEVYADKDGCEQTLINTIYIDVPGAMTQYAVTGSGDICNGDPGQQFGVAYGDNGVNYTLYLADAPGSLSGTAQQTVVGSDTPITFNLVNNPGEYYVMADDGAGCEIEMLNRETLIVHPLPIAYQISGSGKYCSAEAGAYIKLESSEVGVEYIVQMGGIQQGTRVSGSGSELTFGPFSTAGVYSVVAYNSTTLCTSNMNGEVTVGLDADIVNYDIVNTELSYCEAEGGIDIVLAGQQDGVTYQVFNLAMELQAEVVGDASGSQLSLGILPEGNYTIIASYGGDGCVTQMNSGNAIVITSNSSPLSFNVVSTEFVNICQGTTINIELDGSEATRVYNVVDELSNVVATATGDGNPLTIPILCDEVGDNLYEVIAVGTPTCDLVLDVVRISVKDAPVQPVVEPTIDMNYCWDADGVKVSITSVEAGIDYYIVDKATGNRISFLSGDAGVLEFRESVLAGTYYVTAKSFDSGCYINSLDFTVNAYPEIQLFNMQVGAPSRGFETINEGEIGYGSIKADTIRLDNSTTGVVYTLLKDGLIMTPTVELPGSGSELDYRTMSDGGLYTINATENGCSRMMAGSVKIYEKPLIAIDDILPVPYGKSQADTSVWKNDDSDASLDINVAGDTKNIFFSLVDLSKGENYDLLPEANRITEMNTDIGNNVKIYPDGRITFTKLPTFYGRDSIDYVVFNTDYLDRRDTARVYFFAGNYDLSEDDNLLIPNAFSPNGDGFNDKFVISGRFESEVAESKLEVYNRWGSIIYRSKGKNYNEDYWDGTSNAGMVSLGQKLPSGTYFYVFKIDIIVDDTDDGIENGEKVSKEYTGFIELRR